VEATLTRRARPYPLAQVSSLVQTVRARAAP